MRLPGINYKTQVQSFGTIAKGDDGLQTAQAIDTAIGLGQQFYDQETTAQATTAIQEAMKLKDERQINLKFGEYDNDGKLVKHSWDDPKGDYAQTNKEIDESVKHYLNSSGAQKKYNAAMAKNDVAYQSAYLSKIYKFQQDNAKGVAINAYKDNMAGGRFGNARTVTDQALSDGLINEADFESYNSVIDYREILFDLDAQAKIIDTPQNLNAYRKKINGRKDLEEKDASDLVKIAELNHLNTNVESFSMALDSTEKEQGADAAYSLGKSLMQQTAGQSSDDMGGDETYKIMTLQKYGSIVQHYRIKAENNTAVGIRVSAMNSGAEASQSFNPMIPNDIIMSKILGNQMKGASDYIAGSGMPISEVLLKDDFDRQNAIIDTVDKYHIIPDKFADSIEPMFNRIVSSSVGAEEGQKFATFMTKLRRKNPVAFNNMQGSKELKDFVYMTGVYGDSEEGAQKALARIRANRSMSEADKADYKMIAKSPDNKEFFDSNVDDLINKKYAETGFLWDTDPEIKEKFRLKVDRLSQTLLPEMGGNQEDAIRLAIEQLSDSFGATNVNGRLEIMENPPERNQTFSGQNKNWDMNRYIDEKVQEAYPNTPMEQIRVEAVFPFDAKNPRYHVIRNNPDEGMFNVYMNDIIIDYRDSNESAENQATEAAMQLANTELDTKKRAAMAYNMKYLGATKGMFNPVDWTESQVLTNAINNNVVKQGFDLWGPAWEGFGKGAFMTQEVVTQPIKDAATIISDYGKERVMKASKRRAERKEIEKLEQQALIQGGG